MKENVKEMKSVSPESRQQNYQENFALLRKKYPEVARWLQDSGNGKALAMKLESGDFAFLLQEDGERHWLTTPENPKDRAKRAVGMHLDIVKTGKPLLLIGIGAGYELVELFDAQPKMFLWMKQPIYVAERSRDILRLNLEIHNWKKILASGRVFFFVGKKIEHQLRDFFGNALRPLPSVTIIYKKTEQENQPFVARVMKTVRSITENRKKEGERLSREINRYYDSLSDKDWQRVFSARRERALRIILMTSKFSTFAQYCTRDVAQGFEALGHQTRTMIEKDSIDRHSTLNTLRNVASFKPDMLFIIDYLRTYFGSIYHKSIPFVCWVQDQLPNLFNEQAAKAIGKRDIVLAGLGSFEQQLLNLGYPNESLSCMRVPTNSKVYGPMNLSRKEREKYGCEVSYVSHHSVPPGKAFTDLLAQFSDSRIKEILKIMFELVKERFYNEKDCYNQEDYELLLLDVEKQKGNRIENSKAREYILREFSDGIGAAFFRQLPLEWIAGEGYGLNLYGRDWERHPHLKKYARGVAHNGTELCKIYNCSQINLQLMQLGNLHPRVTDGLASGGFFLTKYHPDDYEEGALGSYLDMDKDIIEFRGKDDLLRKVRFYLDHPEERRLIVERARKKVLERLTYSVSMQLVIDKVKERIERG